MKKRLPLCAWCGDSLVRKPYVLLTWTTLKGQPTVGWHINCELNDPLWVKHKGDAGPCDDVELVLDEIYKRDARRVS